jgi:lipid II:glycine glycyltransferase (peptidoglycan interpeptide bridge formation enzyme)
MIKAIKDKITWMTALQEIGNYDFYHTYDGHHISKKTDEEPNLLVYHCPEDHFTIALPLLIRKIEGTDYFDASSVYGYGGPLASIKTNLADFSVFKTHLQDYLKAQNIISVFARLHPYIPNQELVLASLGAIKTLGKVVNIDLKLSADEQLKQYSKTTKRYLKKIKKTCSVDIQNHENAIFKFIELYEENMNRVKAKSEYFFPKEYYLNFANAKDFKTDFVFVELNDTKEIISGAMIIYTNEIVQYHLSGTSNAYLNITPIRLILDEIRIKASEQGYSILNLGGGLGSQEDSLFSFKSSFSKDLREFKVWNYICNQQIYDKLSAPNKNLTADTNFFPLYRFN